MAEASTNGTGELAFPTRIPTGGLVLPCGGALIGDLRPAQLALLLGKVAALVHAEGARWIPLLAALQAERATRLDRGRMPRPAVTGEGEGQGA